MDDEGFIDTIKETREMVEILKKESNIILNDKVQDDDESLTDKGMWRHKLLGILTKFQMEI